MKFSFTITVVAVFLHSFVSAEPWAALGPQPLAMGGAYSGVARGNLAQFWNPAGLAQENNVSGLQIPFGVRTEFTGGLLKDAYKLSNIASKYSSIKTAQKDGSSMNADQMSAFIQGVTALSSLNSPSKGLLVDVHGAFSLKIGKFALAVHNYTSVGGTPFVDTVNIGLGAAAGVNGISFSAATVDTAISAENVAAANQIKSAINTIGYANIENLICGAAGCLTAQNPLITNADSLANVLVDQAEDAGQSSADIAAAAQIIADNASLAAPLISAAASGNSYTKNTSNLTLRGAFFTELAVGYAHPLVLPGLLVGANLKVIQGRVGYKRFEMLQKEVNSSNAFSDFDQNSATSIQPAVDLGALYDLDKTLPFLPFKPRAGLVVRNINQPKFDQPKAAQDAGEGAKYPLDSQVRVGASLRPMNFWTIAMDMDLTKNKTPIPGFKSRMFGLGTEINVFNRRWLNLPLRFGIAKNMAASGSKIAYTGGFGLNILHFILDVGGSISKDTEKFNKAGVEKEVPANAGAGVQIAFLF